MVGNWPYITFGQPTIRKVPPPVHKENMRSAMTDGSVVIAGVLTLGILPFTSEFFGANQVL